MGELLFKILLLLRVQIGQGLLYRENEYWRCTAIDTPLRYWNIPKTSDIVTTKQRVVNLVHFKAQDLIMYAYTANDKCYFNIIDERTGQKELVFAAKKEAKKVVLRTKNWFDMGLGPHGGCDWGIDIEQVGCQAKRPVRCIINCQRLITKWDNTKCVYMDILSPTVIKPGRMNITVQVVHMANEVESVPIIIFDPVGRKYDQRIPCGLYGQSAQSSTHHESPYCRWEKRRHMIGHGCNGYVELEAKAGTWTIRGPYEVEYKLNITIAHPPVITSVGPYVIKKDVIRTVMVEPRYSLKIVTVPLHVSTIKLDPACQEYVIPLLNGWNRWLHIVEQDDVTPRRPKRDLAAKLMGGVGASLSAMNTVSQIRMAQKLAGMSNNFATLTHPIQEALLALNYLQIDITKLLPLWLTLQEQDNLALLHAIGFLQANLSTALACVQAQTLLIDVAKDIIRDSLAGKVPVEVIKLLKPQLSKFEQENPEWWTIIDASYDLKEECLQLAILTLMNAQKEHIHPIIPIGLFVNRSLMLPLQDRMWAHINNHTVKTVNLQACVEQMSLGYTCTTGLWEENHICLNSDQGECHYDLHPSDSNNSHSVVVQVAEGCICIRSLCPVFTVNTFYKVKNLKENNICLCRVFHLQGCDIKVYLHQITQEQHTIDMQILKKIEPIHIGPNLNAMTSLFHHVDLISLVKEITALGNKTGIIVQHAADKICKISKKVQTEAETHHWWDIVMSFDDLTSIFSHPLTISYMLQIGTLLYLVILTMYVCHKPKLKYKDTFVLKRDEEM